MCTQRSPCAARRQTRSDNFEAPLFFLWGVWFTLDLAATFSKVPPAPRGAWARFPIICTM